MEIKISNIKVEVTVKDTIKYIVCQRFHFKNIEVLDFKVLKKALDARKKDYIVYDYTVYVKLSIYKEELLENKNIVLYTEESKLKYGNWNDLRPVVVGFGPAGMFAALYLARSNARPIIIERGSCVDERIKDVDKFIKEKVLNEESNIQFGEGGAGTFSDGKLTTNVKDPLINFILNEFYLHGAKEEVTYLANPHVGTDYLRNVVKNIREEIKSLGGEFYFNTKFIDYKEDNELEVLCSNNLIFKTNHLLLGLGHSAKDTIRHLYSKGLNMEAKNFSIGLRIEHKQEDINKMQYGQKYYKLLPAANYKGAVHLKDRSVYTFCMCPGGEVIASANNIETIVTNGMSNESREKDNANSAILVGIDTKDFVKTSPLDGFLFQEKYEKYAFNISKDYRAPANLVYEFLNDKIATSFRSVKPSYAHGLIFTDFNLCLPKYVVKSIKEALVKFDKLMPGFAHKDAILTGVETRSSSPVKIVRNEERASNINKIYPIGEGAGYAGGITSAALDGLKTAILITNN